MSKDQDVEQRQRGAVRESLLYVCAESFREGAAAHVHVSEIIAGLRERGWQVELCQPEYPAGADSPTLLQRLSRIVAINRRAAGKLDRVQAIYCRAHPLLFPVAWLARRKGLVVVQECNGPYADVAIAHPWTRRILGLLVGLQRWQYRNASAVVTVTERLRQWLNEERGADDVRLISNAANTALFTPQVRPEPPVAGPYVVFFGALAAWHGAETMLAAVGRPEWPDGVRLVVIGHGALSDRVQVVAAEDERVVALGRQPYRRIPSLIVGARAGLVPIEDVAGRAETGIAPLKLFETLAVGVPVIATDYPTQADIVREHACGLVIAPGDPAALARAVADICRDPERAKAMGQRGAALVAREHSWAQRAGEVDALITALLERQHGARVEG